VRKRQYLVFGGGGQMRARIVICFAGDPAADYDGIPKATGSTDMKSVPRRTAFSWKHIIDAQGTDRLRCHDRRRRLLDPEI
jgi:hypothetical protein